ncbi:hypothetical protein BKA59DRAFT_482918 [Fusarium tricinctum]|uniref:Uncharacterized protein n=1 Tax=Fusarium tricinctum TaxID=61284 RepID=A0A8K0RR23_9HYPO|nr:hypothetical protein BKA59DRAFT_482918 [Fusarium tricinctum]
MMIAFSCLVIPLLVLEGCWVYLLYCKLVSLLFSLSMDDPWKPYFLWTIYLLLVTAFSVFAAATWTFLAARLLKVQVSYIRALINLPTSPNGSEAEKSRSRSPAPWQSLAPPNTPESAVYGASSTAIRPSRTPEPASSTLPYNPKMTPLHRQSLSTAAFFVQAYNQVPAGSPTPRPDSQDSSFCEADNLADRSATTILPAARVPNRASSEYREWWEFLRGSTTTPDMSPPASPRLPATATSSTPPTCVQKDSEGADVAADVEDAPMERPSIPVPSRTFRAPVSPYTTRFPERARGWSASSYPGSNGNRRCT